MARPLMHFTALKEYHARARESERGAIRAKIQHRVLRVARGSYRWGL
jgi:hypothetical protein